MAAAARTRKLIDLKARLVEKLPCIGAWSTNPSPLLAEAMASCGFHWLAVDMEHAPIGLADAAAIFMAAERQGVVPMARMPSADPYLGRRLLDAGARGLIVPVVESAEAFGRFAHHLVYPAAGGRRGVGLSRANRWGDNFDDYTSSFRPVLAAQIETCTGVGQSNAIASLPEVDALFLGPYDLSADQGTPGQFETPAMLAAMDQVKAACIAHNKALGYHQVTPDHAALRRKLDEGYRFLAFATDVTAMRAALGRPLSLFEA